MLQSPTCNKCQPSWINVRSLYWNLTTIVKFRIKGFQLKRNTKFHLPVADLCHYIWGLVSKTKKKKRRRRWQKVRILALFFKGCNLKEGLYINVPLDNLTLNLTCQPKQPKVIMVIEIIWKKYNVYKHKNVYKWGAIYYVGRRFGTNILTYASKPWIHLPRYITQHRGESTTYRLKNVALRCYGRVCFIWPEESF